MLLKRHITTIILFVSCFHLVSLWADPVAPMEIKVSQPDGTTFVVIPRGDEYGSWTETSDGHTVVRKNDTWFYAEKDGAGRLRATSFRVGELSPAVLQAMPLHVKPMPGPCSLRKKNRNIDE